MLVTIIVLFTITISMVISQEYGGTRIGAFNIQTFGKKKMSKEHVINYLVKIIQRYDILLVQEIRDKSETAIWALLDKLNEESPLPYKLVLSDRLGPTKHKEQYAYFYKDHDGIELVGVFQSENLQIHRPPFVANFVIHKLKIALLGIHTDPDEVEKELRALYDVYDQMVDLLGHPNIIILGDFNAGGSCISKTNLEKLRIKGPEFHWIIDSETDTTVGHNTYSYDRIVVTGQELLERVKPCSGKAYRFDNIFKLNRNEAREISDHYPVEFVIDHDISCHKPDTKYDDQESLVQEHESLADRILNSLSKLCFCC